MPTESVQTTVKILESLGATSRPEQSWSSVHFDSLVYDSRKVVPGSCFFCVPGERTDGNEFIADAIARGASCIVSEKEHPGLATPHLQVPDVRLALALAADTFFGQPSRKMRIIGVTDTNGKTTTTHLIEHVLNSCGKPCGLIGTLGARWTSGSDYGDAKHTTPQAPELQQLLSNMHSAGCSHVAMEVSSHSLALKRVAGCHFSSAVLTNITQDHLDFHKTMDHYWRTKRALFEIVESEADANSFSVVNLDDHYAKEFTKPAKRNSQTLTYGY